MSIRTVIAVTALIGGGVAGAAVHESLEVKSAPTQRDTTLRLSKRAVDLDTQNLCYIYLGGKIIFFPCRSS